MWSKCGDDKCIIYTQVREIVFPDINPAYACFLVEEQKAYMHHRQKNGATSTDPSPTHVDTFVNARIRIEGKHARSAEVNNKQISMYIFDY